MIDTLLLRMRASSAAPVFALLGLLALPAVATAAEPSSHWQGYGDLRLRLESDWDSQTSNGSPREARDRLRVRARFGFNFTPAEGLALGARVRSGAKGSQQSPHATVIDFNGNPVGASDLNFDKWFVKYSRGPAWASLGRDGSPFWQQNELLWDEDVTVAGAAAGYQRSCWALTAGYFALPVGMRNFSGNLGAAQLRYGGTFGQQSFTVAAGYYRFDADPGDPDAAKLRAGNGSRDYQITSVNGQWKFPVAGQPVTLGVDLYHNSQSYPLSMANRKQKDGRVFSVSRGQLGNAGDWMYGAYYAHIERFAVNASYAQDDWVRWGSADQTDASDFRGVELRLARALSKNSNLMLRYYAAEALTSVQDGKRLRLDWNYRF